MHLDEGSDEPAHPCVPHNATDDVLPCCAPIEEYAQTIRLDETMGPQAEQACFHSTPAQLHGIPVPNVDPTPEEIRQMLHQALETLYDAFESRMFDEGGINELIHLYAQGVNEENERRQRIEYCKRLEEKYLKGLDEAGLPVAERGQKDVGREEEGKEAGMQNEIDEISTSVPNEQGHEALRHNLKDEILYSSFDVDQAEGFHGVAAGKAQEAQKWYDEISEYIEGDAEIAIAFLEYVIERLRDLEV